MSTDNRDDDIDEWPDDGIEPEKVNRQFDEAFDSDDEDGEYDAWFDQTYGPD